MISRAEQLVGKQLAQSLSGMTPGLVLKLNELATYPRDRRQSVVNAMMFGDRASLAAYDAVASANRPRLLPQFDRLVTAATVIVGETGPRTSRINAFFQDFT